MTNDDDFRAMAEKLKATFDRLTLEEQAVWIRDQRVEWLVHLYELGGRTVPRRVVEEWVDANWERGPW